MPVGAGVLFSSQQTSVCCCGVTQFSGYTTAADRSFALEMLRVGRLRPGSADAHYPVVRTRAGVGGGEAVKREAIYCVGCAALQDLFC